MSTPASGAPTGYFDARPLTDAVSPADVEQFTRARRSANPTPGAQTVVWVVAIALLTVTTLPILIFLPMGIGYALGRGVGAVVGGFLGLVFVAALGVGIGLLMHHARRTRDLATYRLARFAAANAMTYLENVENPPLPGMIFGHGSSRRSTDIVRGLQPRFVEFGNYQYTTGSGKESHTHRCGYVAVKLDVPLPHIVLDALDNNALGVGVGSGFQADQRLSLEGDFDRYFSLFCPAGYEVDALYLFTPDVMARFIDHAAQLDVEIVDDWLFLYTHRPASTLDTASWAWLFGAVAALLTKLDQWARWRDDRLRMAPSAAPIAAAPIAANSVPAGVPAPPPAPALPFVPPTALLTPPPPGVAPPGQRLRRRSPWLIVAVVLGIAVGITLLPVVIGAIVFMLTL